MHTIRLFIGALVALAVPAGCAFASDTPSQMSWTPGAALLLTLPALSSYAVANLPTRTR